MPSAPASPVGPTVALTHELEEMDALARTLSEAGARILEWSVVRTLPTSHPEALRKAAAGLGEMDWVVFTSRRAVPPVVALQPVQPPLVRVAAVGSRVAEAVAEAGWTTHMVGDAGADALGSELAGRLDPGSRVLFPAGDRASGVLESALRTAGAAVTRVEAYRTRTVELDGAVCASALEEGLDVVTFLSPSAVLGTTQALDGAGRGDALRRTPAVCIGATTGNAAREAGFVEVHESPEQDKEAVGRLVQRLLEERTAASTRTSA